ncbi:DUF3307 domain-containing protein [Catellatospora sp. KI3]|uniref:DUF3307 domain-containing protein n=1 Tax=Catellatospora sp. KI3 TaxID=3041620 RepID=UPI0024825CEA|nr:DUF3307 domain-containing protein [Catellatospora sp. KI3]MDI1463643.1 DUF3307 domain-containing protein [Catellatospora sp. KI3]
MSSSAEQLLAEPLVVARAATFAVVLLVLYVGHQVGDHVAQTDRQAEGKAEAGGHGWRAMAGHLLGYHLTLLVLLLGTTALLRLPLSWTGLAAGLGFSLATHGLLDRRWPVRAILRATGSPRFAELTTPVSGMYAADQALHLAALLIYALLIVGL